MDLKDILFKELQANKEQFNSSCSDKEKMNAFRKQFVILDQITKSSSESERISVFRSQFKECTLTDDTYNSFIHGLQRSFPTEALSVKDFLRDRCPVADLCAEDFLRKHNISLEPECSGKYKSCRKEEVNERDLTIFKNMFGDVPPVRVVESPPRKLIRPDVPITEKETGRHLNINQFFTKNTPAQCSSIVPGFRTAREELNIPNKRVKPTTPMEGSTSGRPLNMNQFFNKNTHAQSSSNFPGFRTAREELMIQNVKKNDDPGSSSSSRSLFNYGASKKSLGARRNVRSGFVPPIRQEDNMSPSHTPPDANDTFPTEPVDERLRNISPKMVELITNEIMHKYKPIDWDDIAGLDYAKSTIKEAIVWPLLRPDIFTGLRRPPRGVLLFGPPGTGKTLIGKCIASQSKSTFFSISASSLTSKWVGDGEKMVRALFAVAAVHQPSVVFIDEIDSLLSQRSTNEHESSRRLKTEFLVQLDGASTTDEERILIVGATNRPQELDEAARRRLVRRLYIPLPELPARIQILTKLLQSVRNNLTKEEITEIGNLTGGYSGADMENLCREASMEPIRSIPTDEIPFFSEENVRPVKLEDFHSALLRVRASVSQEDLQQFVDWNRVYGAGQ